MNSESLKDRLVRLRDEAVEQKIVKLITDLPGRMVDKAKEGCVSLFIARQELATPNIVPRVKSWAKNHGLKVEVYKCGNYIDGMYISWK
jgi:hypothetical protein